MEQAEVEIKIQVKQEDLPTLGMLLPSLGFRWRFEEEMIDYYLMRQYAEIGGWNFIRLRNIGNKKYLYTEKQWKLGSDGKRVRIENEQGINKAKFDQLLAVNQPECVARKKRAEYHGMINGKSANVEVDTLYLDGKEYCFLECEMITPPDKSSEFREMLVNWVKSNIKLSSYEEAPSILDFIDRQRKQNL